MTAPSETQAAQRRKRPTRPIADRLWARVDKTGGCWLWQGYTDSDGYGRISRQYPERGMALVHRVAYELTCGPIPEGSQIDHVRDRGCVHRNCCRPSHLEAVSAAENTRRSDNPGAVAARTGVCTRGHAFAEHGYMRASGKRVCGTCARERAREKRAARGVS